MALSLAIVFAILAMIFFGVSSALLKKPAEKLNPVYASVIRNLFLVSFLLIALLFFLKSSVFSLNYILIALGLGVIGYVALITLFKALNTGKVGIVMPITGSSVIFTVLFAVLFYNETLSSLQILSIVIIFIGIIAISVDPKDIKKGVNKISSAIIFALITCFLWGLLFFFYKIPTNVLGPVLSCFVVEFGILLCALIHFKAANIKSHLPKKELIFIIALSSLLCAAADIFLNFGFLFGEVSIVAAIVNAEPLVGALYGAIAYKERLSTLQYVAGGVIIVGIVMLSLL